MIIQFSTRLLSRIFLFSFQVKPLKAKVSKIITWRWVEQPEDKKDDKKDGDDLPPPPRKRSKPRQREYFVKWAEMSYWHCEWVSEVQVRRYNRYIYFKKFT